ncbi:MAG: DUF308 domain-containing protein [Rikenellaceae bacterium]|nr:DUF308 domain-containing protein [Rikenellaceae bacterium]
MKNETVEIARRAVKNWWVSVLIGVLAIALGIWCTATPDSTLVALSLAFIVVFLMSGILEIAFAATNSGTQGWGWNLAGGILDLLLGFLLMTFPLAEISLVLVYFVGFWLLIRSIWGIGAATDLSRLKTKGWGWLLTLAILGVIFSFLFFVSPMLGGAMVVWLAGCAFIFYGLFRIYLGVWLQSLHNNVGEVAREIEKIEEVEEKINM